MKEKLIIIGGVAAGMSAAAKARRTNRELEIVVYEKSGYISYGACGFPYFIKGEIPRIDDLIIRTPAQMAAQDIAAHVHHEVRGIDVARQTVEVRDEENGRTFTDHWDKLIIATGGSTTLPPIPGSRLPGIFTLRTTEDALAIRHWIEAEKPRHGVIVGGSYVGVEMAEALTANGITATIVDMADQVMPTLDADMAALVLAELQAQAVSVYLQKPVKSFIGPAQMDSIIRKVAAELDRQMGSGQFDKLKVLDDPMHGRLRIHEVITQDNILQADIVIFGVGGRPNVRLAQDAGIAIGKSGAIAVDAQQRTNIPNIWAAGAVAEAYHLVTKQPAYVPLATTANKQGRVAGTNAAGGSAEFGGVVGTAVVKTFDLTIAHTGLTEKWAKAMGLDAVSATIEASSRAHYMPGNQPIHVKLVFEQGTNRILGAQMVGKDSVAKRIDVVAAALKASWTIADLADLDLSYAPPFAPVWDPILVAANAARSSSRFVSGK